MFTYITFRQDHVHEINGQVFDKNCVAAIPAENRSKGRDKAFELFGPKFCMEYFDNEFKKESLHYFPRGVIVVPQD